MPLLVGPKKEDPSIWEVYWSYFPYFLATDIQLHQQVDQRMGELYGGSDAEPDRAKFLSRTVIKLVTEKYPMEGLEEVLDALESMSLEGVKKREV